MFTKTTYTSSKWHRLHLPFHVCPCCFSKDNGLENRLVNCLLFEVVRLADFIGRLIFDRLDLFVITRRVCRRNARRS